MAQGVERRHPEAVGNLGELKVVDYAEATRKAADKGHFVRGGRTVSDVYYHGLSRDEVEHLDGDEPRGLLVGEMAQAMRTARAAGEPLDLIQMQRDIFRCLRGVGAARMLTSPSPSSSQPTNPIPNFGQFAQAGQGLGALASGAGTVASGLGQAANFMSTPKVINFADGGKVIGLGAARARRGYDGGGVVGDDDLMFDPNAIDYPQTMAAGLGAAAPTMSFTPAPAAPPVGGTPPTPAAQSQGLGALPPLTPSQSLPSANDNPRSGRARTPC